MESMSIKYGIDGDFLERASWFLVYSYRRSPVHALSAQNLLMERFRLSVDEAFAVLKALGRGKDDRNGA